MKVTYEMADPEFRQIVNQISPSISENITSQTSIIKRKVFSSYHLCPPVVFNGCSKDAFAKLKASSILLSKDNSTAGSGGAVLKGYGDVRLHLVCNQYLLDSCGQTLGLFVIHHHIVDGFGTNSSSQNSYHLKKQSVINNNFIVYLPDVFSVHK